MRTDVLATPPDAAPGAPPALGRRRGVLAAAALRLVRAIPAAIAFALLWSGSLAVLLGVDLLRRDVHLGDRAATLLATYAAGAALGGLVAWILAAALAGARPRTARFAAMLTLLPVATAAGAALAYFVAIYDLYAPEHADILTPMGMVQTAFTFVGGAYIIGVTGLRALMPAAVLPLFLAALLFAWATRRRG